MTAAPNATRMTAGQIARERDLLAREARGVAATATQLAEDVDRGLAHGNVDELVAAVHQIVLRAVRINAVRETAELYAADLDPEATP